MVENRDFVIHS